MPSYLLLKFLEEIYNIFYSFFSFGLPSRFLKFSYISLSGLIGDIYTVALLGHGMVHIIFSEAHLLDDIQYMVNILFRFFLFYFFLRTG